jgi:PAS domain S-box-containing protein
MSIMKFGNRPATIKPSPTLREKVAEAAYRSLLHISADAVVLYDMDGRATYLNPSFTKIFGWSLDELKGKRIPFMPESEKEATGAVIKDIMENDQIIQGFETKWYTKEGGIIDVSISGSRFSDHEGSPAGMLVVIRDISKSKGLETQLQHSQKMEAIGTLAGGIAHNFNNLLMGIQGYTSLMLLETPPNHPNHDMLKRIQRQVESGSKLTNQLLGYAREGTFEVMPMDLNGLIKEVSETFGVTKREIEIQRDLSDDLLSVFADRGQLEQVLMNLFVNAADAMPEGGKLTIRTMNLSHEDIKGKPYSPKPGDYVLVEVKDTGFGMDQDTMEHIFDPFFTTKGLVNGTGLGLASVYGIIKTHGGYIDVASERRKGTSFEIILPATTHRPEIEKERSVILNGKEETILLVDDEEMVMDVGEQLLKKLGYGVLLAKDGEEAIELYRCHQRKIDAVILDMVMPSMDGGETYDRLKEVDPGIKVLLSSGYGVDGQANEILARGCNGFIQKPFSLSELSGKLEGILR